MQLSRKIEFESLQINFDDFGRFWQKSNIYIFLIIWIRKMIPTLDHDNITYIWPYQTRNVSRTMLVHQIYRNFDGLAEKHIFCTFSRKIHHYKASKYSVHQACDVFIHILRGQRRNLTRTIDLYPTTHCFYVFWLNLAKIAFL